jgi:hypothetical protein
VWKYNPTEIPSSEILLRMAHEYLLNFQVIPIFLRYF